MPEESLIMKETELLNKLFSISDARSFEPLALEVFRFQALHSPVYKEYLTLLKINPDSVRETIQIPFLPVSFFKSRKIICENRTEETVFLSSGTTETGQSRHYVSSLELYEKSFLHSFELFYGPPEKYVILALLPSYLQQGASSLVYMADKLIKKGKHRESGFFLDNTGELIQCIIDLEKQSRPYILLGVSYALLDLAEQFDALKGPPLQSGIIMETGGMKGRRKELVKEEIHAVLKKSFGLDSVHSEYGMTELLSQAYSKGNGIFACPPWMSITIRDRNDPFALAPKGKTGGVNITDLANLYSCSFIATQDLGKLNEDNTFEILGRFDNSDLRGCNLLVN